jgi:nucleoside-diphosphate-sugar epimerase
MHVMIIGAAGMIGRKLSEKIVASGRIDGQAVGRMTLVDMVAGAVPAGAACEVEVIAADLGAEGECARLAALKPDVVFHLAAVVSSQAEQDFELGYDVNIRATWRLLDALVAAGNRPRFVFASSLAVYGSPFPDHVTDDFAPKPKSSYGVQKLVIEQLLADYTRKGFIRGIALRLPTIVIRPGKPNAAASGFLSGILREPLNGQGATLPVAGETRVWIAPPSVAVDGLLHGAGIAGEEAVRDAVNLPGLSITIADMLAALEVFRPGAAALVTRAPDEHVARIVKSWPGAFCATRAIGLGFAGGCNIERILKEYIEETDN